MCSLNVNEYSAILRPAQDKALDIRPIHFIKLITIVGIALMLTAGGSDAGDPGSSLPEGPGRFVFEDTAGNSGKPIPVWYHRAKSYEDGMPVVFVMHGNARNAEDYRDGWIALAEKHRFLVIAPEFSEKDFPGPWRYSIGNVFRATGDRKPEAVWVSTLIEKIFDRLRRRHGVTAEKYDIVGHSAGAQLVHRIVLFKAGNRIRTAIAANAGWYTMADDGVELPYGIAGSGIGHARLRDAFATKFIVLLGAADTNPYHHSLRRSDKAMAQGRHRVERGENFFRQAKAKAAELGGLFAWEIVYAKGVGHDGRRMADFAAELLGAGD